MRRPRPQGRCRSPRCGQSGAWWCTVQTRGTCPHGLRRRRRAGGGVVIGQRRPGPVRGVVAGADRMGEEGRVRRVGKPGSFRYSAADLAEATAPEQRLCGHGSCDRAFTPAPRHRFCSRGCKERNRKATMPPEKRRERYDPRRANNREAVDAGIRRWREKNPERTRELYRRSALNRAFSISLGAYWALDAGNGGRCWLCSPKREKTPKGHSAACASTTTTPSSVANRGACAGCSAPTATRRSAGSRTPSSQLARVATTSRRSRVPNGSSLGTRHPPARRAPHAGGPLIGE